MCRGIRQGCPISMIFFATAADALTRHVKENDNIKGFQYQKLELKILQYADDTSLFFQKTKTTNEIMHELDVYEKVSGQKINKSKTQSITNKPRLKFEIQTQFPDFQLLDNITLLGITFSINANTTTNNWQQILQKLNP